MSKDARLFRNRNTFILAFPGMGKTPLSMRCGKFKDVDFGTFRTAMGFTKENEDELLPSFRNYLFALNEDWSGATIMTNEPKMSYFLDFDRMYLPTPEAYRYSAEKMHVDVATIARWVKDWEEISYKMHIPTIYVSVGLDHYFLD